jgi:hypothetical protein
MALAGSGSFYSLGKRTNGELVRERTRRLFLPLFFGTLVLIPPQVYVERLVQGRFQGSYLAFYPRFFDGLYPEGNLTVGHLWFLAYLFAYSLLTLPLLRWARDGGGRSWVERLGRWCRRPGGLLLLGIPAVVGQLILRGRYPRTLAFVNDWSEHAWLLAAFFLGFLLVATDDFEEALDRQWRGAVPVSLAATAGLALYAWLRRDQTELLPTPYTLVYFVGWTVYGAAGWSGLLVLLGWANQAVRRRTRLIDYAASGVYPFYVLHQTVIVVTAYYVTQVAASVWMKFLILTTASLLLTGALTHGALGWGPTRRLLGVGAPRKA